MQNSWLITLEIILLFVAYAAGWFGTLLGLPGTWLMVLAAALYAWIGPGDDSRFALGWPAILILSILALLGEFLETAAGAAGAKRAGGSRRGMLLAILGSVAGAMIGAGAGVPIPVIGPLIGAILGAAVGAFVGAVAGEVWKGREFDHSWRVGESAFWGRLIGTLAKLWVATVMVIVGVLGLAF